MSGPLYTILCTPPANQNCGLNDIGILSCVHKPILRGQSGKRFTSFDRRRDKAPRTISIFDMQRYNTPQPMSDFDQLRYNTPQPMSDFDQLRDKSRSAFRTLTSCGTKLGNFGRWPPCSPSYVFP